MAEQNTLLILLLLVRLDTDHLQMPVAGQLRTWTLFLWTPKYLRQHICVNDVS